MRRFLILLLIAGCVLPADGQDKSKNQAVRLHSINAAGLLNGSNGSSAALQTIFGVSIHPFFMGAGVGLDYYRVRSIPLFADLRYELGKRRRSFFLYGDLGYNFDWLTEKNKKDQQQFFINSDYKGGLYYDAGLGYKIGFTGNDALLLSAGYTYKRLKNEVGTGSCPIVGPCFDEKQIYEYSMPRIVFKVGLRF